MSREGKVRLLSFDCGGLIELTEKVRLSSGSWYEDRRRGYAAFSAAPWPRFTPLHRNPYVQTTAKHL